MKEVSTILKKTMLFRCLEGENLRWLASQAIEQHFNRESVLFFAGEESNGLFVIAKGTVRGCRTGVDGREQIIFVERAPATVVEAPVFDGGAYYLTVIAEENTRAYFFDKTCIRRLCLENPAFAMACLRVLGQRVRSLAVLIEELTLHEVGQRLARFILSEADKCGTVRNDEIHLEMNLTRAQIAARIGTVREVVSRKLMILKSEGIIRFEDRRLIIKDMEKLVRRVQATGEGNPF